MVTKTARRSQDHFLHAFLNAAVSAAVHGCKSAWLVPPRLCSCQAIPVATSVIVAVTPLAKIFYISDFHQSIFLAVPFAGVAEEILLLEIADL